MRATSSSLLPEPSKAPDTGAALWLLSLAYFAVGMGAFVLIGILTPVAPLASLALL